MFYRDEIGSPLFLLDETRGNQSLDFLSCMRELRHHVACVVLCHANSFARNKFFLICIFVE